MFVNEIVYKNKRRIWIFLASAIVFQVALLLLFCYKNIFIVFLILCTPPLLFYIFKKPQIGLWLMAIVSFMNISTWGIRTALIIPSVLTFMALSVKILTKNGKLLGSKQLAYFIIFAVVSLLSFFPSRDLVMWYRGIYGVLGIFVVLILTVNLIETRDDLWRFIYIIVFTVAAGAIYGLYLFKTSGFLNVLFTMGSYVRGGSVVADANVWAVSLITVFPLTIALLRRESNLILKLLLCTVIAILIPSIFATFSRGGMLAFSIVVIIVIFKIVKKKFIGIIIVLLLLPVAYFILPLFIKFRIKSLLSLFQSKSALDFSLLSRFYITRAAFKMFLAHPFLGVGISNVVSNTGLYCPSAMHKVAHSIYLEIAAGTGLLGLIPFLAIFFYSFKDFIISYKAFERRGEKSLADLSFYAGLSLLGVCIAAAFLSIQYNRCIWFLISISVVIKALVSDYKLKK